MDAPKDQTSSFEALAHVAMDFLCIEFGYRCVTSSQRLVRYESSSVFCEVGHDDYDAEVYARVGRLQAPGVLPDEASERLDFSLFLAVADPTGYLALHRDVPYSCARESSGIRRVLARFAEGFKGFGRGLVEADPETYRRARELRFWDAPKLPSDSPREAPNQPTSETPKDEQTNFNF